MKKTFTTPNPLWILLLLFTMMSFGTSAQSGKPHATKTAANYVVKSRNSANVNKSASQLGCAVDLNQNGIYFFLDSAGNTFEDFLCADNDSVSGTFANGYAYYDGDGYAVNLYAGSQVTFMIDSCTGASASLTICDSANTVIPGAYSAAACGNTLNFTATYDGTYIVVMNVGGICGAGGSVAVGQVYVYPQTGTTLPPCTPVVQAACPVDLNTNGIYYFNDSTGVAAFQGYICDDQDSVTAVGLNQFYDGDGYVVNIYAGSQMTFRVDNCTGNPVSLTLCDSADVVIPGYFSPSACGNSLSFTAPYSGSYIIAMHKDGDCTGTGTAGIGDLYCVRQPGTSLPACEPAPVNDTICGALPLVLNAVALAGNTISANGVDAIDGTDPGIIEYTGTCSTPNNTLWYSYTPASSDSVDIIMTAAGTAFASWLGNFSTPAGPNSCTGTLTYETSGDCLSGTNTGDNLDSAINRVYLTVGNTYYFMVDGYSGAVGQFTIAAQAVVTGLNEFENNIRTLTVFPNPANDEVSIKYNFVHSQAFEIQLTDVTGRVVLADVVADAKTGQKSINVKGLSNGVYVLRLSNEKGSSTRKVLVQH